MTLPKKGVRKITVDGQPYVWRATGNDGWIDLIVCARNVKGQKLLGVFGYHSEYVGREVGWLVLQRLVVTPGIVEQVIRYGLAQGWQPLTVSLPDVVLGRLDDKIRLPL